MREELPTEDARSSKPEDQVIREEIDPRFAAYLSERGFAKAKMAEIIPNLFLGDWDDAMRMNEDPDFLILTVFDVEIHQGYGLPEGKAQRVHVPIMQWTQSYGPSAREDQLELAALIIEDALSRGRKVLVHCMYGAERGPLTVAWYLWKKLQKVDGIEQAYGMMEAKRSVVQRRMHWLRSREEMENTAAEDSDGKKASPAGET